MIYLKDATFIDWHTHAITRGHLAVEPGDEGGISFVESIPTGAETFDCDGKIVTKSFAIGHHHIYSALARGMPPPARTPTNFVEILELIWWNLDKKLDTEMIRASAMAAGIDAALAGTTFIIDHHASPNAAPGSLHTIAEALDEIGLAHLLCYELSDRDGPDCLKEGLDESEDYLKNHQAIVGLHASFTVSPELLRRAVEMSTDHDSGLHIHVAEDPADEEHCLDRYGCTVAERLRDANVLDFPKTILAHCLHLDDVEREIVRESNAWIVHNTQSNQNNNVGSFDPRGLGERVFVGTDGMHSDMLSSARAMYLEGQTMGGLSPADAVARLNRVHEYLATNGYRGDNENNLVVLDYQSPTPVTKANWAAHVMYALNSSHVHTVIARGRLIVKNRRVVTIDAEAARAHAREQAERLWALL